MKLYLTNLALCLFATIIHAKSQSFNGLVENHHECLTMTIGNSSHNFWKQIHNYQTLQITPNWLKDNSNTISWFLRRHVKCSVVLVTHLDFFLPAINSLKLLDQHIIVYSGTMRPPNSNITAEDRPIIMLQKERSHSKASYLGDLYCPRETKSVKPWMQQIILPDTYGTKWIKDLFKYINMICPNPLSKQTLYGGSTLGRIVRNGKVVGGHNVKLFWYLGEKFNFNAVHKVDIGGYDAQTRTYKGMSKKVNLYINY